LEDLLLLVSAKHITSHPGKKHQDGFANAHAEIKLMFYGITLKVDIQKVADVFGERWGGL
jgi:hypothetical protein